ncbi:MAG: FecR domain-containing protein [Bacteroidales bacterium]|nr:FecR domain-containing protein [Bacteroidales bacterium]
MKEKITILLNKIFNKEANVDDVKNLNESLLKIQDEEAYSALSQIWNEYESSPNEFETQLQDVKLAIDQKIKVSTVRRFNFRRSISIAWKVAAVFLLFVASNYLFDWTNIITPQGKNISIVTKTGERAMIELPDGSMVQLNSASKLTYSSNFNQKNRSVELDGEAFFDIRKSKTDKFVVKTKHQDIEVMGTRFNVFSYQNEQTFEVTLLSGKVKVVKKEGDSNPVILKPNEKYISNNATSEFGVTKSDTNIETAWMRGELIFRREPLKLVLARIERFYGVNIDYPKSNKSINSEIFTGRFENGSVDDVLKVLTQLYPIEFKKINKSITLSARNK